MPASVFAGIGGGAAAVSRSSFTDFEDNMDDDYSRSLRQADRHAVKQVGDDTKSWQRDRLKRLLDVAVSCCLACRLACQSVRPSVPL